jgi:nucleolar MIF4G domain-containing protein 1
LFVSTQHSNPALIGVLPSSKERAALEEVFLRVVRVPNLALGISYFINEEFEEGPTKTQQQEKTKFCKWAAGVALEVLRTTGAGV